MPVQKGYYGSSNYGCRPTYGFVLSGSTTVVTSSVSGATGDDFLVCVAGEDLITRDAVFIDTNSNVLKANPVNASIDTFVSSSYMFGFTLSGALSGADVQVDTRHGKLMQGFSGLTAGRRYFLSASKGAITLDPSHPDQAFLIYQVGVAKTSTKMVLMPQIMVKT